MPSIGSRRAIGRQGLKAPSERDPGTGRLGVIHGTRTFVLQTEDGQIADTHSISAGLDYAAVGPEHAYLRDSERAFYTSASDEEALRQKPATRILTGPGLELTAALDAKRVPGGVLVQEPDRKLEALGRYLGVTIEHVLELVIG